MDFESSNDSKKINLLYSQKIIHDDFFTNQVVVQISLIQGINFLTDTEFKHSRLQHDPTMKL